MCNICVYFGDVRQFSSSQKDVQKHSLTGFDVARCATKQSSTQHQACELVYGKHRPTFPTFQQAN